MAVRHGLTLYRAADDSARLSILKKMREQIRGPTRIRRECVAG